MLQEIVVNNLAIIRQLEVFFDPGLNVVSGETGAGKSILVGAVNLILGSRASQDLIRSGAKEAMVEALFKLPPDISLNTYLGELGIEFAGQLLIQRTISRSGRNRIFVNDQLVTLQQFQPLAASLASISGQHEHQTLLNPEIHLGLLDAFAHLDDLCQDVASLYRQWSKVREELRKMQASRLQRAEQLMWMQAQLQELEAAGLKEGEKEALEHEVNVLKHAATLHDLAQRSYQSVYLDRDSILGQLASVDKDLEMLAKIDASQEPLQANLNEARIHLEELAHALQKYASGISLDSHRLTAVEERLAALQRLTKKYGGSYDGLLQRRDELRKILNEDEQSDLVETKAQAELKQLQDEYLGRATELSAKRMEAGRRLAGEVEAILANLDMHRARFDVQFEDRDCNNSAPSDSAFSANGLDHLQFLLSANPGEDLKPLSKVASGGELSRILLALKSLLSRRGEAETLIFDEVDAGIGGRTAELVGRQLKLLAEKHQVICITHLPQIACYGDHHYRVAKQAHGQETLTEIELLSHEARIEELARMLGGIAISDKTRAQAIEFLQRAQQK